VYEGVVQSLIDELGRLPGVGLPSMADRAAELGGRCAVAQLDGGGTRVTAHLPLTAA